MVALAVVIGGTGLALGRYLYLRDRTALPGPARTKTVLAVVVGAAMPAQRVAPTLRWRPRYRAAQVQARLRAGPSGRPRPLLHSATPLLRGPGRPDVPALRLHPVDRRGGRPDGAAGTAVGGAPRRWRIHHAAYLTRNPPGQRERCTRSTVDWSSWPAASWTYATAAAAGGGGRRPGAAGQLPDGERDLVVGDAFGHAGGPLAPRRPPDGRRGPAGAARARRALRAETSSTIRGCASSGLGRHRAAEFDHVALVAPPAALAGEQGLTSSSWPPTRPCR